MTKQCRKFTVKAYEFPEEQASHYTFVVCIHVQNEESERCDSEDKIVRWHASDEKGISKHIRCFLESACKKEMFFAECKAEKIKKLHDGSGLYESKKGRKSSDRYRTYFIRDEDLIIVLDIGKKTTQKSDIKRLKKVADQYGKAEIYFIENT